MSAGEPTQQDALMRLSTSTAVAIAQVLEMFAPGQITRGDVTVLDSVSSPFARLEAGSVAASVSYVDGVTGANVFVAPPRTARALAELMGVPPEGEADAELSELEMSAVSEASNQMMAAAASALSVVLGQEVEISPPVTQVIEDAARAEEAFGNAPHATSTTFSVGGEPCRLIQLIPNSFVIRVTRALDEMESVSADSPLPGALAGASDHTVALTDALSGVNLRVWAELGRTELALGEAAQMPLGSIVELDRATEAPIELYVNGLRFAQGRLMVSDEGRWLFELDELTAGESTSSLTALSTR